jgi:hypothetical protein
MGSGPSTASDIHPSINYIQVLLNNMKQIFKPVGNAFVKTGSLIRERMPSKRNINNFISVSKIKSQKIVSNSMNKAIQKIKQPQSSQQNINKLNGGKRKKPSENKKKPSENKKKPSKK